MSWSDLAMNGRILIVDDAMENIQILHHALRDEHDVLFALSGEKRGRSRTTNSRT